MSDTFKQPTNQPTDSYAPKAKENVIKSNSSLAFILFVAVIILAVFPVVAICETSYAPQSDFLYELIDDKVYITAYLGTDAVVNVPPEIEGKPVVSVHFPISTTKITYDHTVKKVILPDTVRELAREAFAHFMSLSEIEGLGHIEIIGVNAFMENPVRELNFSESLQHIGGNALSVDIEKITLPDNVQYDPGAFEELLVDQFLLLPTGSNPTLALLDGMLYTADPQTLIKVPNTTSTSLFSIPEGTLRIVNGAFRTTTIQEVSIPASVVEIEYQGFRRGANYVFLVTPDSEALRYVMELQESMIQYQVGIDYYIIGINDNEYIPFEQQLDNIIQAATTDGMNAYQKALALHDWIVHELEYDYSYSCSNTPRDVLKTKKAVCQGYADTYAALLTKAGITNAVVGNATHAFNAIFISGHWIFADCTWDDGTSSHIFFGFNERLKSYSYGPETGGIHYDRSLANAPQYHYWNQNGYMDNLTETVCAEITEKLSAGLMDFIITPDYSLLGGGITDFSVTSADGNTRATSQKNVAGCLLADYIEVNLLHDYSSLICSCNADGVLTIRPENTWDDFTYVIDGNECTIVSYHGNETNIVVPKQIEGVQVCHIGNSAFNHSSAETISLPEGLLTIDSWAFNESSCLTEIVIPDSVTSIGFSAFSCSALKVCTLPASLQTLGDFAFSECHNLKTITIPSTVSSLGQFSFARCLALTKVAIPEGIVSIGDSCFSDCYHLADISLPTTVQSIGASAFKGCLLLKEFVFPEGIETITQSILEDCVRLESVTIPTSVKCIASQAFMSCQSLTTITLPSSISEIGEAAFYQCRSLTSINIPYGITTLPASIFSACEKLSTLLISDSVCNIGDYAFYHCPSLRTLTIPNSVTHIGDLAFFNCRALTIYCTKNSATEMYAINNHIYYLPSDSSNHTLTLPENLTHIDSQAFSGLSEIERIVIPYTVSFIAPDAFEDTDAVFIIGDNTYIKEWVTYNNARWVYAIQESENE